jgi:hypothetical protein
LASTLLFLAFGWLGLCGMNDCLGSGHGSSTDVMLGAAVIAIASIPLAVTSLILFQNFRRKPLDRWIVILGWVVLLVIGALGVFQVVVDPGDAFWVSLPMLIFSSFLALSILNYPVPEPTSKQ